MFLFCVYLYENLYDYKNKCWQRQVVMLRDSVAVSGVTIRDIMLVLQFSNHTVTTYCQPQCQSLNPQDLDLRQTNIYIEYI